MVLKKVGEVCNWRFHRLSLTQNLANENKNNYSILTYTAFSTLNN